MNKNKFSLNSLLRNNKFVLIVAVLVSVSIWVYMSMGSSNDTTVTVANIPIQIELPADSSDNGLQVFSGGDQTASVIVTGNRAIIGSISESDIIVSASAASIDTSGDYELSVTAAKSNPSASFTIQQNITPSTVKVYVDYLRESTFNIQDSVVYKVSDGYYASTSLSNDTVAISGPQSVITKIAKVSAVAEVSGTINKSTEAPCELRLYDEDNKEISTDLLTMSVVSIDAKISVLPEKTVNVIPSFTNKPEGLEITDDMIKIEPETITLAAPKDVLDKTDSVTLEAIDFTTLKDTTVSFDNLGINIPADSKNISNTSVAKFSLDLSGFESKKFTVDNFETEGLSSEYKANVAQNSLSVTVIGPKSQIDELSESDITAVIDTKDSKGTTGSVQMPVSIKISGADSCWAYGSYKANLTITKS